jgi:D-aspartate ligase
MNKDQSGAIIIEGHVQGLSNTRSLGEAGIPVFVVDKGDCVARHSKYCLGFFKCPPFDSDELVEFLIDLARDKGLKGWLLLPSNDHAVLTISRNKKRLEGHFKVITPGLEIIENIYDKSRLLAVAEKVGMPVPGTYYASDASPMEVPLSFPVLTRGRFGLDFYKAMGRKAFLAEDVQEFRDQLARIDRVFSVQKTLTQELIQDDGTNKTISFTAFCVNGGIKAFWMGIKVREHPIQFGTATFAQSACEQECYDQSVILLNALDYTGVCEVEYLKDPRDGQYKLIEINARTWLWVSLARRCGVDFPLIIYNYLNNTANNYPDNYPENLKWVHIWTDLFFSIKGIVKKKYRISEILRSYNGKKEFAVFSLRDIKPFIFETIKLPYIALNR